MSTIAMEGQEGVHYQSCFLCNQKLYWKTNCSSVLAEHQETSVTLCRILGMPHSQGGSPILMEYLENIFYCRSCQQKLMGFRNRLNGVLRLQYEFLVQLKETCSSNYETNFAYMNSSTEFSNSSNEFKLKIIKEMRCFSIASLDAQMRNCEMNFGQEVGTNSQSAAHLGKRNSNPEIPVNTTEVRNGQIRKYLNMFPNEGLAFVPHKNPQTILQEGHESNRLRVPIGCGCQQCMNMNHQRAKSTSELPNSLPSTSSNSILHSHPGKRRNTEPGHPVEEKEKYKRVTEKADISRNMPEIVLQIPELSNWSDLTGDVQQPDSQPCGSGTNISFVCELCGATFDINSLEEHGKLHNEKDKAGNKSSTKINEFDKYRYPLKKRLTFELGVWRAT